jgi:hypothetical protein
MIAYCTIFPSLIGYAFGGGFGVPGFRRTEVVLAAAPDHSEVKLGDAAGPERALVKAQAFAWVEGGKKTLAA